MARLPKSIIKKYGITKKAWAVFRGRSRSRSKSKTKTRSVKKTARRRYYRRRRRGGGKSIQRTAFKMIRLAALVSNPLYQMMRTDRTMEQKLDNAISGYTGYSVLQGNFEWNRLVGGWSPYFFACLATHGIPKATAIIRKL